MKVKALVSFSGAFSMYEGEVRECSDDSTLQDLLRIKYVEEVIEEPVKANEIQKELENLRKQIEELKQAKEVIEEVKEEAIPKQTKGESAEKPKKDVKSKNDSEPDNK